MPTGPAVEGTLKVSPNTESFIKLLNPYGQLGLRTTDAANPFDGEKAKRHRKLLRSSNVNGCGHFHLMQLAPFNW